MGNLRKKQSRFAVALAKLILWADEQGYEVTLGDAYRHPDCPYGHPHSLHKKRLAIDLNLFRDDRYLRLTDDHMPLGIKWEELGGSWGGRFADGNHYSFGHGGFR